MSACVATTFPTPSLLGAEFLSVQASLVQGYDFFAPADWRYSQPTVPVNNVTFCNITTAYTHPGQNDIVYVETWLPNRDSYNGRLQAVGGGGWVAGRFVLSYANMAGAIVDGYASVTTDAGLGTSSQGLDWIETHPGNPNYGLLSNLGFKSLGDEAVIAKQLIESYYGDGPKYSYWNGCSQGGRQGLMNVQRYPDGYDGVIAAAPAIYWVETFLNTFWGTIYMDVTKQYPNACELTEITSRAIEICDAQDGVVDGIISYPEVCLTHFDPTSLIGSSFRCNDTNSTLQISSAAVAVAQALWTGPKNSNGEAYWYGFNIGTDLTTLAVTSCNADGTRCNATASASGVVAFFETLFPADHGSIVQQNSTITFDGLEQAYKQSKQLMDSFLGTHDADVSQFKESGGKILTYHGQADPSITPHGTLHYYNEISRKFPDVHDFYRYFKVPGLGHCWGGSSSVPTNLFGQLRAWVENGTAPTNTTVTVTKPDNRTALRPLCAYPERAVYMCNADEDEAEDCWSCLGGVESLEVW